jgi:hypothetical protein
VLLLLGNSECQLLRATASSACRLCGRRLLLLPLLLLLLLGALSRACLH